MCKLRMTVLVFAGSLMLIVPLTAAITAPDAGGKLVIGYDGTDVTVSAGTTLVESWNDQVALRSVDNAVSAGDRRPELVQMDTGNGLHNVIDFSGTNYLKTADFAEGDMAQTNTIFVVAQWDSLSSDYLFDGISSSERHALYTRSDNSYGMFAGAQIINGNVPAVTGQFQVFAASFNGSSGWFRVDGTTILSGNIGSHVLGGLSIGSNYGASGMMDGKVAEVLVYDGGLNTAQLLSVEEYLANKYLVPEPTTMILLAIGGLGILRRKR